MGHGGYAGTRTQVCLAQADPLGSDYPVSHPAARPGGHGNPRSSSKEPRGKGRRPPHGVEGREGQLKITLICRARPASLCSRGQVLGPLATCLSTSQTGLQRKRWEKPTSPMPQAPTEAGAPHTHEFQENIPKFMLRLRLGV